MRKKKEEQGKGRRKKRGERKRNKDEQGERENVRKPKEQRGMGKMKGESKFMIIKEKNEIHRRESRNA